MTTQLITENIYSQFLKGGGDEEKLNNIVEDIVFEFKRFLGIKNYNGSPKTVSVIAKADPHDPDSIVYEFELISRSDGKSDEDQDDKRAIQRAINAAQISELAGTETYGDGSLPGKYDEDGNFITWSDFNTFSSCCY